MTTVNSLTVFLLIGNLQIEITADFWQNLGIQYWSIESDYCVQHSLSERAIYSTLDVSGPTGHAVRRTVNPAYTSLYQPVHNI